MALALLGAALAWLPAPRAEAFEFFDGRLQIHGFFEEQIRAIGEDLDPDNGIDLAQWYHVLSIELEYDFAPDGFGPFDVLSSFVRLEARYDCVWTRACGLFPSADAFGNRVHRLPDYKTDGRRGGFNGQVFQGNLQDGPLFQRGDLFRWTEVAPRPVEDPRTRSDFAFRTSLDANGNTVYTITSLGTPNPGCTTIFCVDAVLVDQNRGRPARLDQLPGFSGLFPSRGPNQRFEAGGLQSNGSPSDDPAYFVFSDQFKCRFGVRNFPGGENGVGTQIIGPINPRCRVEEIGALRDRPNPFNPSDISRVTGVGGAAELPGRPASVLPFGSSSTRNVSQGVYYPSPGLRRYLQTGDLDDPEVNFSQNQLAWNRGASQDERELKEAYLDMEFFDSQLWIRAGKQSIVWGKTELFRTTDQFNPQDLALASLPSLEESRIALWSMRAVWSFYDVGPVNDLRLEVAANFDDMEPADIGRCGEPFTALVACNKTTGLWAHGLTGFALIGEDRPDSPWQDFGEGIEYGARLEFRLGRFSFQLSNFYGYDDFPYTKIIQTYDRNVDPITGRPLVEGARGGCDTDFAGNTDPDCLPIQSNILANGTTPPGPNVFTEGTPGLVNPENRDNVLSKYGGNIQLFSMICATSIGFNNLDRAACGQSIFNSLRNPLAGGIGPIFARWAGKSQTTIASLLSNAAAGQPGAGSIIGFLAGVPASRVPFVPLNVDPCDGFRSDGCVAKGAPVAIADQGPHANFSLGASLNEGLTDEQQALLGCGRFWGTDCEADGIDLLNAEASVILQSFAGFEGVYQDPFNFNMRSPQPLPGTLGFQGGTTAGVEGGVPAGRFYQGRLVKVAGSRGPFDDLDGNGVADHTEDHDGDGNPREAWEYDANVDGTVTGLVVPTLSCGGRPCFGPAAGQQFANEMAAVSWNIQVFSAALSQAPAVNTLNPDRPPERDEFDYSNPFAYYDPADPTTERFRGQCTWVQPQFCSSVVSLIDVSGVQRNRVSAGGTREFGRRDFVWHSGSEAVLRYERRNVLGFSMDFAEDVTKSNWGVEAAWIQGQQFTNNNDFDGLSKSDTYNLTISVDRPTFINFLNSNRTFFFNSQLFFQYVPDYQKGFTSNGPWNMFGTFTVQTGYFQDRLLPGVTFVYDQQSNSGAALPSISYRMTENLSATVGMNFFFGRFQFRDSPLQPIGTVGNEVLSRSYRDAVENGLAVVRERDEIYLRIRYTF